MSIPKNKTLVAAALAVVAITIWPSLAHAQPGGPGGFGGPNSPDVPLVKKYDKDSDGILNNEERAEARLEIKRLAGQGGRRGRRGPGGRRGGVEGKPGPKVSPAEVTSHADKKLYDRSVVRTFFLEFESDDWEQELADFKPTDVEIPAKLTVDGKTYPNVGLSFRGASSFFMIQPGSKRSLNMSMDFMDSKQTLYGYKSLNLLNCNGDAAMMSSAIYSTIANEKIPAPKVNFVKVVINGESWGIYSNVQQFDKVFLKENFGTKKGTRWKVHGSPQGDGGLRYIGDKIESYRKKYEIKSSDNEQAWKDMIELCRLLDETPADQIEEKLGPVLDIDGVLWFLAVDVATCNSDGYWTRASDYSIYQGSDRQFHILPHDMNESFRGSHGRGGPGGGRPGGGPGGGGLFDGFFGPPRGGPGAGPGGPGGGVELDPLVGIENARFPLRSKLLANEKLQKRYLQYVRAIAEHSFSRKTFGGNIAQLRELIEEEVAADTRKLSTTEAFKNATSTTGPVVEGSLLDFAEKRSAYLLGHEKIKTLPQELVKLSLSKPAKSTDSKGNSPPPNAISVAKLTKGKSPVVINEVMASNKKSFADPEGNFDDWIELHNSGDETVDISGWYLSDDPSNVRKWKIPAKTKLAPGKFLLIWADEDSTSKKGLHANFKLSAKGETLVLSSKSVLYDKLTFGKQADDRSFGRVNPTGPALKTMAPSPQKPN